MADKNILKSWFETNDKPTQEQFWAWLDSYFHKNEKIPITSIEQIENILNAKADKEAFDTHLIDEAAHSDLFSGKEDKSKKGAVNGYAPLNEFVKLAAEYLNIVNDVIAGGTTSLLSAEQGKVLQSRIDEIWTRDIKIIPDTTYILTNEDFKKILHFTANSDITLIVPDNLNNNGRYEGKQLGDGQISFGADGSDLLTGASNNLKTAHKYSPFAIDWISSGTYIIYGELELA